MEGAYQRSVSGDDSRAEFLAERAQMWCISGDFWDRWVDLKNQVSINWADLGLGGKCVVRDLWSRRDIGTIQSGQAFRVKPHAAALYRVTPVK